MLQRQYFLNSLVSCNRHFQLVPTAMQSMSKSLCLFRHLMKIVGFYFLHDPPENHLQMIGSLLLKYLIYYHYTIILFTYSEVYWSIIIKLLPINKLTGLFYFCRKHHKRLKSERFKRKQRFVILALFISTTILSPLAVVIYNICPIMQSQFFHSKTDSKFPPQPKCATSHHPSSTVLCIHLCPHTRQCSIYVV